MSQNSFLALAPELKQAIFSHLPDVSSLLSTLLTCSSFYHAFLDADNIVLVQILESQTHPSVAFDALAAFTASNLGPTNQTWSKEEVRNIMRSYDGDRSPTWSRQWNLRDALAFQRLNEIVEYFTMEFGRSALNYYPAGALPHPKIGSYRPPSVAELGRIKRTFYRFELYCNLFRTRKSVQRRGARGQLISNQQVEGFSKEEQYNVFFARFPVWENEQLYCVHDFLLERLSIQFNDVAEHDIEWGELSICYYDHGDLHDFHWKEGFLVHGLTYLHELVTASIYDERHRLLNIKMGSRTETLSLCDGLTHQPRGNDTVFAEWSPEARDKILSNPRAADIDTGPKDAWLWAHEDAVERYSYDDIWSGRPFLRRCGYVMWDSARWKQWELRDMPWEDWEDLQVWQEHYQRRNSDGESEKMQESFRARSRIWCRGGRGWWAPGDESRVVWPGGKAPEGWLPADERSKRDLSAKQARRDVRRLGSLEELLRANQ